MKKYYVAMTDKFMSGWGQAYGLTNKYIVECDTWSQAETVAANARKRDEMKYINIHFRKPYYNSKRYLSSFAMFDNLGTGWTKGYDGE